MDKPEDIRHIAFIGGGNVASQLIPWMQSRGFVVTGLVHRTSERAAELALRHQIPTYGTTLDSLPPTIDALFLSVPDAVLAPLARELAAHRPDWKGVLIAHFSGALPARILQPLQRQGGSILSMHPLQTIRASLPTRLEGIPVILEGPPESIAIGKYLAYQLSWHPFELSEEEKPAYHVMAVMASNFLVTLFSLARDIAPSSLTPSLGEMLYPIMEQTLRNLRTHPPEEVLTGPVTRGDVPTIAHHLETLQQRAPHLLPTYLALLAETLDLALRGHRLSSDAATQMLERIEQTLHTITPPTD